MAARVDPYKAYRFLVEIDGIQQAGFTECTGFGSKVEAVKYREGGDDAHQRNLIGQSSYGDITLKWGATNSKELHDWHVTAITGQLQRKNGSVILCDDTGTEQVRWNFYKAWPKEWQSTAFNATGNNIAIETLIIACEYIERV